MAFYDTIESIKKALEGYSEDETRLKEVYEKAAADNEKSFTGAKASLDNDYRNERNLAYSDNARDERNVMAFLAERGLGFSGEAAQAKLNSKANLNNRFSQLSAEQASRARELESDFANKSNTLSLDYIDKLSTMNNNKNKLSLDLASLVQKNEQSEAERAWEKEKFESQLRADAEALALKNAQTEAELAWEKEKLESQLRADAEALDKKLQAERDMQNAELYAKYYRETNSGTGGSSGSGGSGGSGGTEGTLEDFMNGFLPDIKPKDLAKLMVNNATDGNYINDERGEYLINKYLVDMIDSYRIDNEYFTELVFMLKAYGYNQTDLNTMRKKVLTYDAKEYYSLRYQHYFDRYVQSGIDETNARKNANTAAKYDRFEFIRQNTSSYKEFYEICVANGIPDSDINAYASKFVWGDTTPSQSTSGGSGGGKLSVGTRVNMFN